MSNIPDDVVERALSAYWGVDWMGASNDPDCKHRVDSMRAAGRVFMEWALEEAAKAVLDGGLSEDPWEIADRIRALAELEKSGD